MLRAACANGETVQSHQTRRRYSSFLSLHQALTGLYPVLIIPPIPSKQSLADYAVKGQSKAKEDATVIARRKRLLEDFLRRLVRHPILGGEHVLHRFLEDGVSWVRRLSHDLAKSCHVCHLNWKCADDLPPV